MHRKLIPALAALIAFAAPAARAADDDAKAIITKAIKAHGGEEALTKYKAGTSTNKGKIDIPGVGEVEFTQQLAYMLPDKLKDNIELSIGGQTIKINTLVNGDKASIDANGQKVDITDAIKDSLKDAQHMISISRLVPLLKDKDIELSTTGEVKVEAKPAVGVRVVKKGQKDINLYFDKKSGLLSKIEHRTVDGTTGNEITEERIIVEYEKNKDGVPMPKKVLVKHDGKKFLEAEVIEAAMLEKIDESEFKK